MSLLSRKPAINGNRSRDLKNSLITPNINNRYHYTRLFHNKLFRCNSMTPKNILFHCVLYSPFPSEDFSCSLSFTGHVTQMLETLNRKRAKIIKFYRVTKFEVFSVNFRDFMVVSVFYAN